jgi:hypothetical protein
MMGQGQYEDCADQCFESVLEEVSKPNLMCLRVRWKIEVVSEANRNHWLQDEAINRPALKPDPTAFRVVLSFYVLRTGTQGLCGAIA